MRTLTREEAAERAGLIRGVSCEIELDVSADGAWFKSRTRVRFECAVPGRSTFIELLAPTCRSIRLNGRELAVVDAYDGQRIALDRLEASNELVVEAECAYTESGEGVHRSVDPEDGQTYLFSECFLYEAQRIFACFDQPDLKASFTLHMVVPEGWIALSNGAGTETSPGHWTFEPTPPLPTYLVGVNAGPYETVRSVHGDLPLDLHCRRSMTGYLESDDILADARIALDFMGDLFGRPYPFSKLDLLFVPEVGGAMENAACITFSDDFLFRSPVTDTRRRDRTDVICHEIAHMWFGDLVTMRWWDDLWLNESFASYLSTLTMAMATRHETAWTTFALTEKAWGYWADQLPTTHPISADVPDALVTMLNMDGISYAKGAGTLKQLVAWVGLEPFRRGLQRYIKDNAFENTSILDLLAALEAASGRDLRRWAREWLQTAGVSTLASELTVDDRGRVASFAVLQSAPPANPTLRSHRIAIGTFDRDGAGMARTSRVEVDVVGARTDIPDLVGRSVPDLIVLNDDDLTWARTRLDDRSLRAVLDGAIPSIDEPLTRAVLWLALREMTLDAILPVGDYVRIVLDALPSEPEITMVEDLQRRTLTAITRLGDPARREERLGALADRSIGWLEVAPAGSDDQLAHARALARSAVDDRHVALLADWLNGRRVPEGLTIGPALRWEIVGRLAVIGRVGGAAIDVEYAGDPTASGAIGAATARVSLPTAAAKAEAWASVLAPEPPSLGVLQGMAAAFWHPEHADVCRPYVERYIPEVGARWGGSSQSVARILSRGLFPAVMVEASTAELIRPALADTTLAPAFRRILAEQLDDLERALATRGLDAAPS
jgi:aminopeptidase N